MRARGWKQADLARRLGVRDATVSDWFNRDAVPMGDVLLRMPEALEVSADWLFGPRKPITGAGTASLPAMGVEGKGEVGERARADDVLEAWARWKLHAIDNADAPKAVKQNQKRELLAGLRQAIVATEAIPNWLRELEAIIAETATQHEGSVPPIPPEEMEPLAPKRKRGKKAG